MSVTHIGHWPFRDQTGTGPIIPHGVFNFGNGGGCIVNSSAAPYITGSFPLQFNTKEEAMWWFWKVRTWQIALTVDSGRLDGTHEMLVHPYGPGPGLGRQEQLVCCHDGIVWQIEQVTGDLHFNVYLYACSNFEVGAAQVYYNPTTGKWLPKIRVDVNVFKTEVPEEQLVVGSEGPGPNPFTCTVNGYTVNLTGFHDNGSGIPSIVFTPVEFW